MEGFLKQIENILFFSWSVGGNESSAGACSWISSWFTWSPTSEKLLEEAESQILQSEGSVIIFSAKLYDVAIKRVKHRVYSIVA